MISSATAIIDCEYGDDYIEVELVEMANGTWGDDTDVELPKGWKRVFSHGNEYAHYCPNCNSEPLF